MTFAMSLKMNIRTHSDGVNAVRLTVSELGGMSLKYTSGTFRALDSDRVISVGENGVSDTVNCVGSLFFGIEVKVTDTDELSEDQESFRDALIAAGGEWVLADFRHGKDGCEAVRLAVHHSTAQTRENIEASLQRWCEHFGLDITDKQEAMLINLLTPGFRYAD